VSKNVSDESKTSKKIVKPSTKRKLMSGFREKRIKIVREKARPNVKKTK
jgi:hypothetical protein